MSFICGSFRIQEEDDFDVLWPFSSPSIRKSTRKLRIFHSRGTKHATNPYAGRGLDKFEALLADLAQKRQNILAQKRSEDISTVKFVYKSPNEIEPAVIKVQDQTKHQNTGHQIVVSVNNGGNDSEEKNTKEWVDDPTKKIRSGKRKIGEHWWKPCYYFPIFVILILVLLMFSGRSLAILCTSVGWYLAPVVKENLYNSNQPNNIKKKE